MAHFTHWCQTGNTAIPGIPAYGSPHVLSCPIQHTHTQNVRFTFQSISQIRKLLLVEFRQVIHADLRNFSLLLAACGTPHDCTCRSTPVDPETVKCLCWRFHLQVAFVQTPREGPVPEVTEEKPRFDPFGRKKKSWGDLQGSTGAHPLDGRKGTHIPRSDFALHNPKK